MKDVTKYQRLLFYQAQIDLTKRKLSAISDTDNFAEIKRKVLKYHIRAYQEELSKLKPDNLNSWT